MGTDQRIDRARLLYEGAVFGGEVDGLAVADRELDGVEADLALARGRVIHARFLQERNEDLRELALFERAAELYHELGDVRGEAESLFWIGIVHQVVRDDSDTAIPFFERSHERALQVDDKLTLSYVLRHLGLAEHAAGRLDAARERLQASVDIRREIGFLPGVAANLVGLTHIATAQGRHDDARALIEEARAIAEANGAHGILRHIDEARASL
jgi:tetratricopeptide (TPR) repeat protein